MQILVDMSTPRQVFEALEAAVRKHLIDNPLDFTGDTAITMDKNSTAGNEPLKVVIMIYWCYKFNGAPSINHVLPLFQWHLAGSASGQAAIEQTGTGLFA